MSRLMSNPRRRSFQIAGALLVLAVASEASAAAELQRQAKDGSLLSFEGPAGREYTVEEIGARCVEFEKVKQGNRPLGYRECRVTESGEFGAVEGDRYYYATYCLMPNHVDKEHKCGDKSSSSSFHSHSAMAIFTVDRLTGGAKAVFRLIGTEYWLLHFRKKPQIVRHGGEILLWLPVTVDGTGHHNDSRCYVRRAGRWEPYDTTSWVSDLVARLPASAELWKGTWPDMQTLTSEVYLYRKGDANCCASGGVARVRLRVAATRLEMVSVEFEQAEQ